MAKFQVKLVFTSWIKLVELCYTIGQFRKYCHDDNNFRHIEICANTLKAAGVPSAQAEVETVALSEVLKVNLKELVTKEDLKNKVDLLRRDIKELEQRLIIKLGTLMALSIGLVAALVKLL